MRPAGRRADADQRAEAHVASGQAATSVTFEKPGSYVLRGYADDGVLLDSTDVMVTVTP